MPRHSKPDEVAPTALIIHGGAGFFGPAQERAPRKRAMLKAVRAGAAILRAGGSALDAVIASVVILEDDPLFNAGYGSTLNADGAVEMDASVMIATAAGSRAGAVAAVTRVRNPIQLARAVMDHTPHVLMVGAGAERVAREHGIELCDPAELIAPRARERFLARSAREREAEPDAHGTVGAAALDRRGQLAAATSTGGVPGKLAGRVGDSAIIGAGTFANMMGAASATGNGEAIIMTSLCRQIVSVLGQADPTTIARRRIAELIAPQQREAGIILVDHRGRVGYAHNAETMEVAFLDATGPMRHERVASIKSLKPRAGQAK
jgi:beta-aspartyl-peptidase (threonine type)